MKALHGISFILVIIGALNWLVIGIADYNVVKVLGSTVASIVYILVGLSALFLIFTHKGECKKCEPSAPAAPQA